MNHQRSITELDLTQDLVGVWHWDIRSNLMIACEQVCAYADIPSEIGIHGFHFERFLDGIHPDDRASLRREVGRAMSDEGILATEYRLRSKSFGTRWVRTSGRCFRDENDVPLYFSGFLTEVGEPKPAKLPQAEIVEHLMAARDLASATGETLLTRLLEAVLIEAGRRLAAALTR